VCPRVCETIVDDVIVETVENIHQCLVGGQVDDGVDIPRVGGLEDCSCVADVGLDEREPLAGKVFNSFLLDGTGVEGIKIIDGHDAVPVVQ